MDDEIKKMVDKSLEKCTFNELKERFTKALRECIERKNNSIKNNTPLYNTESHIKLCYDIIDYINSLISENRTKRINSLFERKILSFNEFKLYNS